MSDNREVLDVLIATLREKLSVTTYHIAELETLLEMERRKVKNLEERLSASPDKAPEVPGEDSK